MSRIAIIGTGRMAFGLGRGWAQAGHTIVFGSRTPVSKAEIVSQVAGATVVHPGEALKGADVVVIAIPYSNVEPFAREHAAELQGKIVIDISNPFDNLPDNRISGAEITATAIGPDARVVAAFKDNFWATLSTPVDPSGLVRDVHFAGDHEADKEIVTHLIQDLGFRPIDCGPLKNARILDGMVPLMIELDRRHNAGTFTSSWRFLNPNETS